MIFLSNWQKPFIKFSWKLSWEKRNLSPTNIFECCQHVACLQNYPKYSWEKKPHFYPQNIFLISDKRVCNRDSESFFKEKLLPFCGLKLKKLKCKIAEIIPLKGVSLAMSGMKCINWSKNKYNGTFENSLFFMRQKWKKSSFCV